MADFCDQASELSEVHLQAALANRQQAKGPGLEHCELEDCGEPISAARQVLGARLCLSCQTEREARDRMRRR